MLSARADAVTADVIIIGGGMVGVTLALMLAQQLPQLRVTLLEAQRFPALDPNQPLPYTAGFDARNTALSRRTVQAFSDLGLWPQLQPHATPIQQIHISERGQFGLSRLRADEEQVESFGQVIENAWLGVVLLAALKKCPSVTLRDGVQVTSLTTSAAAATVSLQQGDGPATELSAPLVIAADGTQSRSRDWLGLTARWHDYGQTALVTTIATSLPHQHEAFERFTEDGPIALLPLPDAPASGTAAASNAAGQPAQTRRSLVWALKTAEAERVKALSDAEFLAEFQRAFGRRAGRFTRVGQRHAYPLQLMVAHQQTVPRAVILGNAAHSLHPVAGQGFNLCLRDVLVLVETLRDACAQGADLGEPTRWQAYEAKRQADQQQIIRFSDSLVRGFSNANPLLQLARNIGLLGFDLLPGAKPLVARYAMGLSHV
ncbi:MAG: 2-octaprenyl-6-methoxyphenyl hydroxylase [Pseudomonadota bacterium]